MYLKIQQYYFQEMLKLTTTLKVKGIFENPKGKLNLEPVMHPNTAGPDLRYFPSYLDKNPYHYDFETFKWICMGTTLRVKYVAIGTTQETRKC